MVEEPTVQGSNDLQYRGDHSPWIIGRLKQGVTPAEATADLNAIGAWLQKTYPADDDGLKFGLARPGLVGDMLGGPARAFMAGLMLLSGLILLAACANLGSLFAARAADRAKEVALRLALGSRRAIILRQLLTEAMLVSVVGGSIGLAGGIAILHFLTPPEKPTFRARLSISSETFSASAFWRTSLSTAWHPVPFRRARGAGHSARF